MDDHIAKETRRACLSTAGKAAWQARNAAAIRSRALQFRPIDLPSGSASTARIENTPMITILDDSPPEEFVNDSDMDSSSTQSESETDLVIFMESAETGLHQERVDLGGSQNVSMTTSASYLTELDNRLLNIILKRDGIDDASLQTSHDLLDVHQIFLTNRVSQRLASDIMRVFQKHLRRAERPISALTNWPLKRMPSPYKFLNLPIVTVQKSVVYFGSGYRHKIPSPGISITIFYRDLLSVIGRLTLDVIYRYGIGVFDIRQEFAGQGRDLCTEERVRTFGWVQNGDFLLSVKSKVAEYLHGQENLTIIPIKVHADGAQMRANGLHSQTPVQVSILHRGMYDPYAFPTVISYIPKLSFEKLGLPDDMKKFSADLKTCMTQAILKHLFRPLLYANGILHADALKKNIIQIQVGGTMYKVLPIIANFACDMPMTAQLSYTLNCSVGQSMPCQVCKVSGNEWFRYDESKRASLRNESEVLEILRSQPTLAKLREMNLRRITEPFLEGTNPWTDQGIFLFAFVDRLHGVQGGILRNLSTIGLTMVFLFEESIRSSASVPSREALNLLAVQSDYDESNDSNMMDELDSDQSVRSEDEEVNMTEHVNDSIEHRQPPRKRQRSSAELNPSAAVESFVSARPRYSKSPLQESSLAARIRRLRSSTRGLALSRLAGAIRLEWQKTWPRRHSHMIPIRLSEPCIDSLSKIGEHKYALGLLLEILCAVLCDTQSSAMGAEYRSAYGHCASRAVLFFCALSHKNPDERQIHMIESIACDLMDSIQHMKDTTSLTWQAPKIHNVVHYATCIQWFGRARLTDTCEGESSMKIHKAAHARVAPKDLHDCSKQLLEYMEHREMTELTHACLRNAYHPGQSHIETRTLALTDYSKPCDNASFPGTVCHTFRFASLDMLSQQGLDLPEDWFPTSAAAGVDIRFRILGSLIRGLSSIDTQPHTTECDVHCFNCIKIRRANESCAQTLACGNLGGRAQHSQQFDFVYLMKQAQDNSEPSVELLGALYIGMRVLLRNRGELHSLNDLALVRELSHTCVRSKCAVCDSTSDLLIHCSLTNRFRLIPIRRLAGRLTAFADVSEQTSSNVMRYLVVNPVLFHDVEYYA